MRVCFLASAIMLTPLSQAGIAAPACDVSEQEVFGYRQHVEGAPALRDLALFWEHGAFIFNATHWSGEELVGEWRFKDCTLLLSFGISDARRAWKFDVLGLEADRLRLRTEGKPAAFVLGSVSPAP